jgi:hypothetical protein
MYTRARVLICSNTVTDADVRPSARAYMVYDATDRELATNKARGLGSS